MAASKQEESKHFGEILENSIFILRNYRINRELIRINMDLAQTVCKHANRGLLRDRQI